MQNCLYWLNTIEDAEIKEKALANYRSKECNGTYDEDTDERSSLSSVIKGAFAWPWTPEGFDYWNGIYKSLIAAGK